MKAQLTIYQINKDYFKVLVIVSTTLCYSPWIQRHVDVSVNDCRISDEV